MENNVFYIRFVDSAKELTSENGLPLTLFSQLLAKMETVLDLNDDSKSFVKEIRTDSYGVSVASTTSERNEKLSIVHKRIESGEYDSSDKKIFEYARAISKIIKLYPKSHIETYPNGRGSMLESKITKVELDKKGFFYEFTTISGVLSEIGGKNLEANPHIYIDGYPYQIHINDSQEKQLQKVYKGDSITVKIREKLDSLSTKTNRAELEEIYFKVNDSFIEGINNMNKEDLSFLDGIDSIDDILEL